MALDADRDVDKEEQAIAFARHLGLECHPWGIEDRMYLKCRCGWEIDCTRIDYYLEQPFGCPECSPPAERETYIHQIRHKFRYYTRTQWVEDVKYRLQQLAKRVPEEDRGMVLGLIGRINRRGLEGNDMGLARQLLQPAEEVLVDE